MNKTLKFNYNELKNRPTWYKMRKIYDTFNSMIYEGVWPGGEPPEWFMDRHKYLYDRKPEGTNFSQTDTMNDLMMTALDHTTKLTKVVYEMGIPVPRYKIGQIIEFMHVDVKKYEEIVSIGISVDKENFSITYHTPSCTNLDELNILSVVKDTGWNRPDTKNFYERMPIEEAIDAAK